MGSTGSIGTQSLEIIERLNYSVLALTANRNVSLLEEQIRKFRPKYAALMDLNAAKELKLRVSDVDVKILQGMEGFCQCASLNEVDMVINSVVGMVGLKPTLSAIEAKKELALANKETLVAGGEVVMKAANDNGVRILPIDSEHSAIFQSLQGCQDKKEVSKLILTASGGPFFGKSKDELKDVTPRQALNHPNWDMGAKITIDSATMMNKGLELIEAAWLFDMPPEDIDIVVHRESIIHSLVEYCDKSVIAQLGEPDMRTPIQYALTYPKRAPASSKSLSLADYGRLTFYEPDNEAFPSMNICRRALKLGGTFPAAMNGANEKAVELYLNGKIKFTDIFDLVENAMENACGKNEINIEDILNADLEAREFVSERVSS